VGPEGGTKSQPKKTAERSLQSDELSHGKKQERRAERGPMGGPLGVQGRSKEESGAGRNRHSKTLEQKSIFENDDRSLGHWDSVPEPHRSRRGLR